MRDLLAQLEERQGARHRGPAAVDSPQGNGYIAWSDVPEQKSARSSFGARGPECHIVWASSEHYDGSGDVFDDCIAVPRAVAKAFGGGRGFRSLDELNETIASLCADAAFDRVLSLCSARERSVADVRKRLQEEGYPPEAVGRALQRSVACGVVDDSRFAESYLASKLRCGWGRSRIERGLTENDIDPHLCLPDYPGAYFDADDEAERARELLAKRPLPVKNPVEKFARFLANRGFDLSTALRIAREEVDARTSDELL